LPIVYSIDGVRGIVHTTMTGKVTLAEVLAHFQEVAADPAYRPHFDGFSDYSDAELVQPDGADIRRLAAALPLAAPSRRAIIVGNSLQFAFGRMVEMNRTTPGVETRVFRSREEAAAWLGLTDSEN
jgi:hypothetical protein